VSQPTICLNMIVRNEAHVVREVLDCVAGHISTWLIVDTGSQDGTQDVIREHMAGLGIPGDLVEREWRDFGHNRTEALNLAAGRADYIWVIDADDLLIGTPDFSRLDADCYELRYGPPDGFTYWRMQLLRDGLPWRYRGVVHEFVGCDRPFETQRLPGDYHIDSRRLGDRNRDPQKYARDRDLLLAEVEREPDNARSVFYLAQSYFDLGEFANARIWYGRRAEMGGWGEEVYYSLFRMAESMQHLGEPWPRIQAVLLHAYETRPNRAETLHAIARHYRSQGRYQLGHLFARQAASIPLPPDDYLFVGAGVHTWAALDEQAVCASNLGLHTEAFTLFRRLLAGDHPGPEDRARIAVNRDLSVPAMLDVASAYPAAVIARMRPRHDADVTVSVVCGPDLAAAEATLNSLVHCCTDRGRVRRWLIDDSGLTEAERAAVRLRYPFAESLDAPFAESAAPRLRRIFAAVDTRLWLHVGQGWRFFAPERLLSRLAAVLDAEPQVLAVAVNVEDAAQLTGRSAACGDAVRRGGGTGRYVLADEAPRGPAMVDTARLAGIGGIDAGAGDVQADLTARLASAGMRTATLDEVLCVARG
jgi:glycosyltransferase involved in cell wall biosynthesis